VSTAFTRPSLSYLFVPVLVAGITQSTLSGDSLCTRYNEIMYRRTPLVLLGVCLLFAGGCKKHILTDYRPLDQAGMYFSNIEELKGLNTSDQEVTQLVKLKQAGITDETCVALLGAAHAHQHPFISADSAASLAQAGINEVEILNIARADQLDNLSTDAVTLKLVGLSDSTVQAVLHRRILRLTTLNSAQIGRLKNTGLTEKQLLERINAGMTDAQAEREIVARENARNQTGFVRVHGRRPR